MVSARARLELPEVITQSELMGAFEELLSVPKNFDDLLSFPRFVAVAVDPPRFAVVEER